MDYSQYEIYDFDGTSSFHISTGYKERSYQDHWHSYGEILLVGPGNTNVYKVNQNTYELMQGDIVLIWPMEMHAIIDANREDSLVIQFSNAFINSLFDHEVDPGYTVTSESLERLNRHSPNFLSLFGRKLRRDLSRNARHAL